MLRIPDDVKKKWETKYMKKGKTVHLPERMDDSDYDIITQYDVELRGLVNYYRMAVNASALYKVKWIMETSLTKTLSNKHKNTVSWVYRTYKGTSEHGLKCLRVIVPREGKKPLTAMFGGYPIRYNRTGTIVDAPTKPVRTGGRTQLIQRMLADKCELCGSKEEIEVHHINSIKSLLQKYRKSGKELPTWIKRMSEIYRNTLVVCSNCHDKIHNGTYDGIKLV